MSENDRTQLLDISAGVDVGQGYVLVWSIAPDGSAWPVLADQRQTEPQFVPHTKDDFRQLAPHEMPGQLPDPFRQFRCGAPTHSGRPCRASVDGPSARCRHHPHPATSKPAHRAVDAEMTLFELEPREER